MEATTSSSMISPERWNFFRPVIQYLLSPAVTVVIAWFLLQRAYRLGELRKAFDTVLDDIKELKTNSRKLLSDMGVTRTFLVSTFGVKAELFSTMSPLRLTDKGMELLKKSGFKDIYQENKRWFLEQVKAKGVKTMAEVDEASIDLLEKMRDDKRLQGFKEVAFQNGVPFDLLLKVCAIFLRDEVASEILDKDQLSLLSPKESVKSD